MQQGRDFAFLAIVLDNPVAVVADRTSEAFDAIRRDIGEIPAPRVPDHGDFARVLAGVDGGLNVGEGAVAGDLAYQIQTRPETRLIAAETDVGRERVKQRRRNRDITL